MAHGEDGGHYVNMGNMSIIIEHEEGYQSYCVGNKRREVLGFRYRVGRTLKNNTPPDGDNVVGGKVEYLGITPPCISHSNVA